MRQIILALTFICAFAPSAMAQVFQAPVLLIDSDKLYASSVYAQQLRNQLVAERQALDGENRRLIDGLRAEELRLTELRKSLPAEDFAKAAAEFNEKAEDIRRTQDQKARDSDAKLAAQRQVFMSEIRPIIGQIMVERRAALVLENSADIFMNLAVLDITNIARDRIDERLAAPSE